MKKILIDILHPAHVHFFRNAIEELRGQGHTVYITSRDKEMTHKLLDLYGFDYTPLSREAGTKGALAKELISRNLRLTRIVRQRRPDIMTSIGGTSTAQVGFITRTCNLIFYDTENATVSNLISYPFATEVITPECYRGWVPRRKHVPYPGYHELAYLHPDRFTPNANVLRNHGLDPSEPFSVVRFVSWKALHDVKAKGLSPEDKLLLTRTLEQFGKVYITSETPLPDRFEKYRLPLPPDKIHHLLAFARLFIGESATMASESAILGTPFIYLDIVGRGYTDDQEERYGLGFNFRPWQISESIEKAKVILAENIKDSDSFRRSHVRMMGEKIDVTRFIVDRLLGAGSRGN